MFTLEQACAYIEAFFLETEVYVDPFDPSDRSGMTLYSAAGVFVQRRLDDAGVLALYDELSRADAINQDPLTEADGVTVVADEARERVQRSLADYLGRTQPELAAESKRRLNTEY